MRVATKLFISMILDSILIVLSYFIPKKDNIIVFGAALGKKYNGNPKYIIEYLHNNKIDNYKYYWITRSRSIYVKLLDKKIPVFMQYSLKSFFILLRAKKIIIDHFPADVLPWGETTLGNFYYINTWHGSFFKKIGKQSLDYGRNIKILNYLGFTDSIQNKIKYLLFDHLLKFDEFLIASKPHMELIKTCFKIKKVILGGYPRNDALYDKSRNYLYKKHSFFLYKKIYLYAPTYRECDSVQLLFSKQFLKKLQIYLSDNQSLFLIKTHPLEKKILFEDDLPANIINISKDCEDVFDVLKYTDCLITDYSGIYFDFLLTNKPTIFYNHDVDEYRAVCRDFFDDIKNNLFGFNAKNEQELLNLILSIDDLMTEQDNQQRISQAKLHFNDVCEGDFTKEFVSRVF